jgi:transglutaminase-like putative cysteine protease
MKLSTPVTFGLLLCVLMVSAPHVDHLPPWVSALCGMVLAWRAYLTRGNLPLPKRWLLLSITVGGIIGLLIEFHTLFGQEAGVTLLVMLTALKLMEMRSARDATVMIYLACFIIITNFFYSQSIPTALFMLATLLVIIATWLHLQTGTLPLKPRLRIAGLLLLQSIPLMLVLFILFPRVQGPLWGMPQDNQARTGLTDTMSPGSISKLSQSDEIAFRVTFNDTPPLNEQMYWRGPVLLEYDGQRWTPGNVGGFKPPQFGPPGALIDYAVMLEPHGKTWLFALEMPMHISIPAGLTYDFQLRQKEPVNSRLRYEVQSQLDYRANAEEEPFQLKRALSLPRGLNPRARQLAEEWRKQAKSERGRSPLLPPGEGWKGGDDGAIVQTALRYFNQQGFSYSLEPPPLVGFNTIDDFLFETKQGFCEHYAGAFVFLMRAAGVPARVVTGYQGAQYNEQGNYYIVRQSDAHAWAEVWLQGRGWVRADPTAAVSPSRIKNGLAAAVPNAAALPFMERTSSAWLLRLRFRLDLIAFQWNQWVLGYNTERQFAFLTRLGMQDITWKKLAMQMASIMALLIGIFALLMLRRLYARHTDEAQRLYLKFCRKLAKAELVRAAHEGPQDFAARVAQTQPQLAATVNDITGRYVALRYANNPPRDGLQALRHAVAAFKL